MDVKVSAEPEFARAARRCPPFMGGCDAQGYDQLTRYRSRPRWGGVPASRRLRKDDGHHSGSSDPRDQTLAQAQVNPSPPTTPGSPFDAGLADRRTLESWFASLTGDFKKGAKNIGLASVVPRSRDRAISKMAPVRVNGQRGALRHSVNSLLSMFGARPRLTTGRGGNAIHPRDARSGGYSTIASRRAIAGV